jgi:hypothetical protein
MSAGPAIKMLSRIGKYLGKAGGDIAWNPVKSKVGRGLAMGAGALNVGAVGAFLGSQVVDPILKSPAWAGGEQGFRSRLQEAASHRSLLVHAALRERRLQELDAQNIMRLAVSNPDLVNQLLAGRRLPKGSVVIGGEPRVDIIQELARNMSTGQYSEPTIDPIRALMGVQ